MKRTLLLFFLITNAGVKLLAQDCEVNVVALKGVYSGDCKNGKAHGRGTAKGIDAYMGDFKNGYPNGEGKYTWQNGSWYEGAWKQGVFDGQGTLNRIDSNHTVAIEGFWKKGQYIGRYEKPYVLSSATNNISNINIRKLNSLEREITVTVRSVTGGASSLTQPLLPKSKLIDIQVLEGRFEQEVADETITGQTNRYTLRKVTYPFSAIFSFETVGSKLQAEKAEVRLYEDSNWYIQVSIDN